MEPALLHGGNLDAARLLFPGAPEPFIDLSTGINPYSYLDSGLDSPAAPRFPPAVFARLPEPGDIERLTAIAAEAYEAPSTDCVVASPGTQILLAPVAALIAPGKAAVLGPTYGEFSRAAVLAGHDVADVRDLQHLRDADLAVVVNPNNPDGRVFGRRELLELVGARRHRGLLVVDEAFMDVGPDGTSLCTEVMRGGLVVLRSFGKFFGLAGVRLGFAVAAPAIAERLAATLGPWAVSGPAVAVGQAALADAAWIRAMRQRLAAEARRLDEVLTAAGMEIVGGTSLFRLARTGAADRLFHHLGRTGILVRRFQERPEWLRFGLPGSDIAWDRLQTALGRYSCFRSY
jgi:cobalamin biosynthetic protein CobC